MEYTYKEFEDNVKNRLRNDYQEGYEILVDCILVKMYPTSDAIGKETRNYGSGVALSSDGIIATCNHVVENSMRCTPFLGPILS
ncbi:MAG: hypothetical protein IPG99_15300 [Ignavibacteria bacterium]|nr:hypothetical protein [Ignavibacteria bacterium]